MEQELWLESWHFSFWYWTLNRGEGGCDSSKNSLLYNSAELLLFSQEWSKWQKANWDMEWKRKRFSYITIDIAKMQKKDFCTSINGCWNHSFDCNDGMDCKHQSHHLLLLLDWIGLTGGYRCHHYYSFRERTTIGISITWKYDSPHLWAKLIISFSDTRFWTKHPKHQIIFVVLQQHLRIKYQDDHPQILSYRHQLVTKCCFWVAKAKPDKQNYQMEPPYEVFANPTTWTRDFHELGRY